MHDRMQKEEILNFFFCKKLDSHRWSMWHVYVACAKCVNDVIKRELELHTIREFQSCLDEQHVAVT